MHLMQDGHVVPDVTTGQPWTTDWNHPTGHWLYRRIDVLGYAITVRAADPGYDMSIHVLWPVSQEWEMLGYAYWEDWREVRARLVRTIEVRTVGHGAASQ